MLDVDFIVLGMEGKVKVEDLPVKIVLPEFHVATRYVKAILCDVPKRAPALIFFEIRILI